MTSSSIRPCLPMRDASMYATKFLNFQTISTSVNRWQIFLQCNKKAHLFWWLVIYVYNVAVLEAFVQLRDWFRKLKSTSSEDTIRQVRQSWTRQGAKQASPEGYSFCLELWRCRQTREEELVLEMKRRKSYPGKGRKSLPGRNDSVWKGTGGW